MKYLETSVKTQQNVELAFETLAQDCRALCSHGCEAVQVMSSMCSVQFLTEGSLVHGGLNSRLSRQ